MVFGIPMCAILGSFLIEALKILKGHGRDGDSEGRPEETEMIQQIYHGLSQMEKRIETLETLLFDRQREGKER
jgi:phage shock protein B